MEIIILIVLFFVFSRFASWVVDKIEQAEENSIYERETLWVDCPACKGSGETRGKDKYMCMYCAGAGGKLLVKGRLKK